MSAIVPALHLRLSLPEVVREIFELDGEGPMLHLTVRPNQAVELGLEVAEPWVRGQVAVVVLPPIDIEMTRAAALAHLRAFVERQAVSREETTRPRQRIAPPQLVVLSRNPSSD